MTTTQTSDSQQTKGQVKWFNNKAGYGFITVCDGEHAGKDIFVHWSAIQVSNSDYYKYLVQGEYVELSITKPEHDKYEFHAANVTGVCGGAIMCETRMQTQETNPRPSRPTRSRDIRRYRTPGNVSYKALSASDAVDAVSTDTTAVSNTDGFQSVKRRGARPVSAVSGAASSGDSQPRKPRERKPYAPRKPAAQK